MIKPTPSVLRWARESARLSPAGAARKSNIAGVRGLTAEERLEAFEVGEERPTMAMLERLAKTYRRPLVAFFLDEPPSRGDRGTDFRQIQVGEVDEQQDVLLDALVRNVRSRQALVHEVLSDEDHPQVDFVASALMEDGIQSLVAHIRERLRMDLADYRRVRTAIEAFALLRHAVEELGVFVLFASDLGSHHSEIGSMTFRGLSIADKTAPFIVINDRDARSAWSFTLLHELTHLWLGQTGFGAIDVDSPVEQFCSDVASEFLLPKAELRSVGVPADFDQMLDLIAGLAEARNISQAMVAYRLYRLDLLSRDTWEAASARFRQDWERSRESEKHRRRQAESGPSYYAVRRHRIGDPLITLVDRALGDGTITSTEAGRVLGINPKNVGKLIAEVR